MYKLKIFDNKFNKEECVKYTLPRHQVLHWRNNNNVSLEVVIIEANENHVD